MGHFAKDDDISVTINGTRYQVPRALSEVTLNEYLRSYLQLGGTKVFCREGGCGACVVTATYPDAHSTSGQTVSRAINSCLCPILSCDGWSITTVEGVGTQKHPHPIQQRLTDHYGTQCGYCSPGMVMSMYSLLKEHPDGKPSAADVETALGGNICRCTGYRPILDAFKTFTKDGVKDVEEANCTPCLTNGELCTNACHRKANGQPVYVKKILDSVRETAPQWHSPQVPGRAIQTAAGSGQAQPVLRRRPHRGNTIRKSLFMGAAVSLTDVINTFDAESKNEGFQYLAKLAGLLRRTAQPPVRNAGSWGGNLAMKHRHPDFQSETFIALAIADATIVLGPGGKRLSIPDFMKEDLTGKVILGAELPVYSSRDYFFAAYKIMPRYQNAHAVVNAGFRVKVDRSKAGKVVIADKPIIVYGSIGPHFARAHKTEAFLAGKDGCIIKGHHGKDLADPAVLQETLRVLKAEIQPEYDPAEPSTEYKQALSLSLFYKFALEAVGELADSRYRSAVGYIHRPVSHGTQHWQTNKDKWPLTKPIPKLEAMAQCTGEAKFISDIEQDGLLHCAFALTEQANADIHNIDISAAVKAAGVVRVFLAADIPGVNNPLQVSPIAPPEQFLTDKHSDYAGQPVAFVVAETRDQAEAAAALVKITYSNIQKPILTFSDAIAAKSFHGEPIEIKIGDAQAGLASAPHKISGDFEMGTQAHYHMETMTALAVPNEDGLDVEAGTQWLDYEQAGVAQVLGIPKNCIRVTCRRNGGGFGAKAARHVHYTAAAAMAAWILKRPAKIHASLFEQSKFVGKRFPYYGKYEVGFDDKGRLLSVRYEVYCNTGTLNIMAPTMMWKEFGDSGYKSENWHFTLYNCKTNLPPNTATRAPGSTEGLYFMEYMLEHIANYLKQPSISVKQLNFLQEGDKNIADEPIEHNHLPTITEQLLKSSDYYERLKQTQQFNAEHRWRKRGLNVVPLRYPCGYTFAMLNCFVSIYHDDGSVAVSHGGIEIGQGINTKVAQTVAYELGIEVENVKILPTETLTSANCGPTGGSFTSEICCLAAIDCCKQLKERMAPVRQKLGDAVPWRQLVEACHWSNMDLSARARAAPIGFMPSPSAYHTFGAMCTEVEVDALTGEYQVNRMDVLYDCGESQSPYVDMGQIEGSVLMGLGYYTSEEVLYDAKTGANLCPSTWRYKPPTDKDIPVDFRVAMLRDAPNPLGVTRGKFVGEPPFCMSASVVFALRDAIGASLKEKGHSNDWFRIDTPMTIERVHHYANVQPEEMVYSKK
ncbi:uncharacterized protein LOC129582465 [Paramacrobiotus metropolitanus]|uniref:uncharacterized protein LOC129582465 n=1 Tax=Paramacrobiotus metropolitanus TaxID=2943436 RepID=UPI002445B6B8|nr:uncharacterized protein LOC129582465 [Paramacrobiotus metropolitanus]